MKLDTESLRALLAVLEHGGMTNAADELDVSQSAISWRIRRLEERVGTELLVRDGHKLSPTEAGQTLLRYAETIVSAHDAAVRTLSGSDLEGTVRLGSSDDLLAERVAGTLGRFRQMHPRSTIELHIHHSLVLDQMLADRRIDLALYYLLEEDVSDDDVVLQSDDLVWVVGENAPPEFDVVPLLSFGEGAVTARTTVTTLRAVGIPYNNALTGSSFASVASALRAGLGVALIDRASMPEGVIEWPVAAELPTPPRVCQVLRLARGRASVLAADLFDDIVASLSAGAAPVDGDARVEEVMSR